MIDKLALRKKGLIQGLINIFKWWWVCTAILHMKKKKRTYPGKVNIFKWWWVCPANTTYDRKIQKDTLIQNLLYQWDGTCSSNWYTLNMPILSMTFTNYCQVEQIFKELLSWTSGLWLILSLQVPSGSLCRTFEFIC